ncbi:6-carboxytetrahydropterin synthase QueD [Parvularcula flava]|uniref:6-carboxy-5,6,7,8-tetrahydropterin synthase n=1 Tax=Aquisalinus luteolus TaxID=1566827 RepID=A0A8J3ERZ0_9PROT|nr:6-carboxytetrahydropterin synthase QueD [Aquisalinus luteolus]NHK28716.1 6-carboxytetrahydropterin synthase QueD [Aquisalinus luteolus]GGH99302.1 6-carboxy-5,6,7,8-tetrahydropterin synthase [Aquisalinus luteolus]
MMRIAKSVTFDAAHYLSLASDERPYSRMHGHSFRLTVELEGEPDPVTGWVEDFGDINDALSDIHEQLDHRLLNEIEGLSVPTLENICMWVADKLKARFAGLARVVVERPSNGEACTYTIRH